MSVEQEVKKKLRQEGVCRKGETVGAVISQLEKGSPRGKDTTAVQTNDSLQVLWT